MLRLSKKANVCGPLQLHAAVTRGITTHQMILNESNRSDKRKSILDLYGSLDGNTGVLKMNREHRFNTLTPHMAESLSRGLTTMDIDQQVSVIYLASERNQHFSNGTDFRMLKFLKQEENTDKIQEYLQRVYQLQCQVAKLNKPVVSVANGHVYNSGASLLASCGFPMVTLDAQIAFNECTFGFVPHSGASFHLSRLAGEFGTFMALTGLPIHGSDAARMGLASGVVTQADQFEQDVADIVGSQEFPRPSAKQLYAPNKDDQNFTAWEQHLLQQSKLQVNEKTKDVNRMAAKQLNFQFREDFVEATDRTPSGVAEAEFRYMQTIRNDFEKHHQAEGYLAFGEGVTDRRSLFRYKNHFEEQMKYLQMHVGQSYPQDSGVAAKHAQLIDRCFFGNSVEEIMDNLRQESHPFAKQCLTAMEHNSMLSMKLTLQMLRQAANLDYTQAMQMELRVATHKIQDEDFDRGVSQVLLSPKHKGGVRVDAGFNKAVSDSSLERYFAPNKMSDSINLGVVDSALLPTRMFYSTFSDQARLWLNEESSTNEDIRETFDTEAKQCLQQHGIDVRDKALTTASARAAISASLKADRRAKVHEDRISQLMLDTKLRQNYFKQISEAVNQHKENPALFYSRLNAHIQQVFEDAYMDKLTNIFQASKDTQALEKRRMLVRFKKFMFKSRILTYQNEEVERSLKQLSAMPFKQIHLQEQWDETFRSMEHPSIHKSPIYHVTKTIGRISMTPVELAKMYTTSTTLPTSLFSLDEKELKALQADILANPEKYEMMLAQPEGELPDIDRTFTEKDHKQERMDEYEYWYRVINDGHSPLDSLPYAKEFAAYKDWVNQIDRKAVDTLKFAVNQLLINLEQEQVTYHGQGSTRDRLDGLLTLMNGEKPKKQAKRKTRGSQNKQLKAQSRSLDDMKELLGDVLKQDFALKPLFDSPSSNQRVQRLQQEAETEILKLLEIVLLDKFGHVNPKDHAVLEQRLAEMTSAQGVADSSGQLRMIDSYLADKNASAVLKEALDIVKPFFLESFRQRLLDEADKCFEHFHHQDNHYHALYHYLFNQRFPGYEDNFLVQRLSQFSVEQDQHEMLAACYPFMSFDFRKKTVTNLLGQAEPKGANQMSMEGRQQLAIEQTKKELSMLRELVDNNESLKAKWREEALKFNRGEADMDPHLHRVSTLSVTEDLELDNILMKMEYVLNVMHKHQYELSNNFNEFDWLKVYGDMITKQNVDMNMVNRQRLSIDGYKLDDNIINKDAAEQWRDDQEWQSVAEYASFISEFGTAVNRIGEQPHADLAAFMARGDTDSVGQESIFRRSVAWRDSEIKKENQSKTHDRKQVIRNQIDEFNAIQDSLQRAKTLREEIAKISELKPAATRHQVADLLTRKYVDLDRLFAQLLESDNLGPIEDLVQTDKLVRDFQAGKTLSHAANYSDMHIDVLSLQEAKSQIAGDESLATADKRNLEAILSHVDNQTKYVANSQRETITLGEFLSRHHFTNSGVYSRYSQDILTKKLDQVVNQQQAADSIVDWQLAQSRTHPVDHVDSYSPEELETFLKNVENDVKANEPPIMVSNFNEELNQEEVASRRDFELRRILREAKTMTDLTADQESTKNMYENLILAAVGHPDYEEEPVREVIEGYTKFRLMNCMMREGFQDAVKNGNNGHIYMKVLKERVVAELGLDKLTDVTDLAYETINQPSRQEFKFDLETPYSLQNINNTNALGYDNMVKRAAAKTPEEQSDLAQQTVFDKLLADYFLSKRAEYKQSNQTIRDLATVFEKDGKSLDKTILEQRIGKEVEPGFQAENFRDLMDLDIATSRALQKGKNGLSEYLRQSTDSHNLTEIPEYYEVYDVRKPADTYVDDKLQQLVQEVFDIRRKLEKDMSRRELVAFDKVLARHLSHENFVPRLQEAVNADYNELHQGKNIIQSAEESKRDFDAQVMKFENKQREYTKSIKNEDAEFKQLAYSGMLERKNREKLTNNEDVNEIMFNTDSFHEFYRKELQADAQREARPIDESVFTNKKPWEIKSGDQFKNKRQREEDYFKDHALYLENKKEQQERIQMFYILEQFFEKSRQNPDPLSEAQQHIQEYFKEPENTFFFDKNKL